MNKSWLDQWPLMWRLIHKKEKKDVWKTINLNLLFVIQFKRMMILEKLSSSLIMIWLLKQDLILPALSGKIFQRRKILYFWIEFVHMPYLSFFMLPSSFFKPMLKITLEQKLLHIIKKVTVHKFPIFLKMKQFINNMLNMILL